MSIQQFLRILTVIHPGFSLMLFFTLWLMLSFFFLYNTVSNFDPISRHWSLSMFLMFSGGIGTARDQRHEMGCNANRDTFPLRTRKFFQSYSNSLLRRIAVSYSLHLKANNFVSWKKTPLGEFSTVFFQFFSKRLTYKTLVNDCLWW